jgi:hypothetical protein
MLRLRARLALPALLIASTLAACGGDDASGVAKRADGSTLDALPTPEGARGSVTGMPDEPGPGQQPAESVTTMSPDAYTGVDDLLEEQAGGLGEDIAMDGDENASDEPPQDAVDAVQQYYAAIEARDYATAYTLWADGGRASGQSPEQFAAGFAETAQVVVTPDAPARLEGAVGSRYIEVPVAVEATSRDGRVRRFVGAYTLRRSVVDGASEEQRAWRIASADLRELTQ